MKICNIFGGCIIVYVGNDTSLSGIGFMYNLVVANVDAHMTDCAAAVFIEYQIAGFQTGFGNGSSADSLIHTSSGNGNTVVIEDGLNETGTVSTGSKAGTTVNVVQLSDLAFGL